MINIIFLFLTAEVILPILYIYCSHKVEDGIKLQVVHHMAFISKTLLYWFFAMFFQQYELLYVSMFYASVYFIVAVLDAFSNDHPLRRVRI